MRERGRVSEKETEFKGYRGNERYSGVERERGSEGEREL